MKQSPQMRLYQSFAQDTAYRMTTAYSTSFSSASSLFDKSIRQDIYNIYGLVRLADEIVDTYAGDNQIEMLDRLEADTYAAIRTGYSTNLIVQAYITTARTYKIDVTLIAPFFESMRIDSLNSYTSEMYHQYIYGSAEVVGLMCLKVFVNGDEKKYEQLEAGAKALGAAFQKVNFLRDLASDYTELGRFYFPDGSFDTFDETAKNDIINDIRKDFAMAKPAILELDKSSRTAVSLAYRYYLELLKKLYLTPANVIKEERIRVDSIRKLQLLAATKLGQKFSK